MAQTIFVGREREQQLYAEFLSKGTPWVCMITGQGGIGKTTLLDHLARHTPAGIPVVTLDFANESLRANALNVLRQLATRLAPYCNKEQVDLFTHVLKESRSEITDVTRMTRRAHRNGNSTSGNETNGDAEDFSPTERANMSAMAAREVRLQIREQVTEAFYEQVDTFEPPHLVLMFDTYEWLSEPQNLELGQWMTHEFIVDLQERMQAYQRLCSVVIASRVPPVLEGISRQNQLHIDLEMLDQVGVDFYLKRMGMDNPELRQQAYTITHGHALSVSILGALWKEQGEQSLTQADFPKLHDEFNERARMEFIIERLDKRLHFPFRELTHYGVLLRSFNLPFLQAVFPEWLPESTAFDHFQQLTHYPYIVSLGHYRYAFHELIRSIQAAYIREKESEQWKMYHQRAFDYLDKTARHSPDWYYHALAYDEERVTPDWLQAIQLTQIRGIRDSFNALLGAANDVTLKLSTAGQARRAYLQGYSHYTNSLMDAASQSYEEALALYHQTGDTLGEANVLRAMGDIAQFYKDMDTALHHYERSIVLYQQVGDVLGEANGHKATGDVHLFQGHLESASQSYVQALALYEQVDGKLGKANVLQSMGDIRRSSDLKIAQHYYQQALKLYQEVGDRLGEANVLQTMGDIALHNADQAVALQYHNRALVLYKQVGNVLGEANAYKAVGDVQRFRQNLMVAQQNYEQALTLYEQLEDQLGKANVLQAIGDIQQFRGELDGAQKTYEEALILYRDIGNISGEANILQAMGDVQRRQEKPEVALESYHQALQLYQTAHDLPGEASMKQTIGEVHLFLDNLVVARDHFNQALALYRQIGSKLGEANSLQALGNLYYERGDYQLALKFHSDSYQIFQQLHDEYSQARVLYYRSKVYEAINDQEQALRDMKEAHTISQSLTLPYTDLFQRRLDELMKLG